MEESASAFHDPDLLADALRGDQQSLAQLLDRYRPYLAILARLNRSRRLQARYDDSDVVQETVTLAYRDFPAFRGAHEKELVAWLRQILAHVAANAMRRHFQECRDARLEQRLQAEFGNSSAMLGNALASADSSPSERTGRRERAALLAEALAKLPEHYREAVILHELEGMSLAEVAQRMGRSANSVQKLLARGVVRLRRLLTNMS